MTMALRRFLWLLAILPGALSARPEVLYFHADWCSWCHRFVHDVLDTPEVQAELARCCRFRRLDADRNRERFRSLGGRGLPFVVALDRKGRILSRFTGVLSKRDFLAWLETLPDTTDRQGHPVATPLSLHAALQALEEVWDEHEHRFSRQGTTGRLSTKHPQPLILRVLLHACFEPGYWYGACPDTRWPARIPRALDAMISRLEDPQEGGFFHYEDPRTGYREPAKRLQRNARILWLLADACRILATPKYCAAARRTIRFLNTRLRHEDTWRSGVHQAPDRMESTPLLRVGNPARIADTAQAALALLAAAEALNDPQTQRLARDSLHRDLRRLRSGDRSPAASSTLDLGWLALALLESGDTLLVRKGRKTRELFCHSVKKHQHHDPELHGLSMLVCPNPPFPNARDCRLGPYDILEPDDMALQLEACWRGTALRALNTSRNAMLEEEDTKNCRTEATRERHAPTNT